MNGKQIHQEAQFYDGLFDKLHKTGAERHPTRWFIANDKAAFALAQLKGRSDDKFLKTLTTLITLRVLDAVIPKEQR